jgi:rubredoxin
MNCPKCKSSRRKILSYELVQEKRVVMVKNKWECAKCTYVFYVSIPDEHPLPATI